VFKIISQEVSEVVDTDPNLYVRRAEQALRIGATRDAIMEIDKAIQYSGKNCMDYMLQKIEILNAANYLEEGCSYIKNNLKFFYSRLPLCGFEEIIKSFVRSVRNDIKVAIEILKQNEIPEVFVFTYSDSSEKNREYFLTNALKALEADRYTDALSYCRIVYQYFYSANDVDIVKADSLKGLKHYDEAMKYYDKIIKYDKSHVAAYIGKIEILMGYGKYVKAILCCDEARLEDFGQLKLTFLRAQCLFKLKRFKECIENYKYVVRYEKDNAYAYYYLGVAYDEIKKYGKAISHYKKAVSIDPQYGIPSNENRDRYQTKWKYMRFVTAIFSAALIILQFWLYQQGILKPIIYNISVEAEEAVILVGYDSKIHESHSIFPFYGVKPEISYIVEDNTKAIADKDGSIKGIEEGETNILIYADDTLIDTLSIQVSVPKVESLDLEFQGSLSKVGDIAMIRPIVIMNHPKAVQEKVQYRATNKNVLKVDDDGEVRAVGLGAASIVIETGEASKVIEFMIEPAVSSLSLDKTEIEMYVGGTEQLKVFVETLPANQSPPPITYTCDMTKLYITSDGILQAKEEGNVLVTVQCQDVQQQLYVNIKPAPMVQSILLGADEYNVVQGDKFFINYRVEMEDKDVLIPQVKYGTNDNGYIAINEEGYIEALQPGTCFVTITCENVSVNVQINIIENANESLKSNPELVGSTKLNISGVNTLKVTGIKLVQVADLYYVLSWDKHEGKNSYDVYGVKRQINENYFEKIDTTEESECFIYNGTYQFDEFYVTGFSYKYNMDMEISDRISITKGILDEY
jgi:tetratricopeptide (TPR) repeat protein